MNEFDKNFHLNMSPLYAVFVFMLFMLWTSEVKGDEIEEVIVVAQQEKTVKADPVSSSKLISSIMPAFTWPAGGYGAFIGYNERGAQTVHTSVYRNGIPVNEPGSAWYDFGHDLANGETVKVISGSNSVMYGSGSIAGTILIKDTIERGVTARYGSEDHQYISVAPIEQIQFTNFSINQHSARNDNEEEDSYKNQSAKFNVDLGDFRIVGNYTDYEYDYDQCFTADFTASNDCVQDGERYVVSVRNDYITLGRSENKSIHFTEGVESYVNESSRDFIRIGNTENLSTNLSIDYGFDAEQEQYGENEQTNYGAFFQANAKFLFNYNFGFRAGNDKQNAVRFGMSKDQFFFNVGNSYRKPNLYEQFGDAWVDPNPNLEPEKGIGYELGFGALSVFRYDFSETIEYADGFMVGDVYVNPQYYNGGDYQTTGFKYANTFGPVTVMYRYTDSDQPRIPETMFVLDYKQTFFNADFRLKYSGLFDREPGPFDGDSLDDLDKLNFYITKQFANNLVLSFKAENILDAEAEILPFYNNEGREYYLTLQYKW